MFLKPKMENDPNLNEEIMSKYEELVDLLLQAPDSQLDASMMPLIKKWSDPPTPLQILEVLDNCIHGSLASGFTIQVLQIIYDTECKATNVSNEDVIKNATWRNRNAN